MILIRTVFIAMALGAWFWTQKRLGSRPVESSGIGDRIHDLTARWNRHLHQYPQQADRLLIGSSLLIDLMGLFVIGFSIVGPSLQPLIALLLIFVLRQGCQASTTLPPPPGMIWRDPHVPTLFVTYGVSNDLFFSGHNAIAVLGALVMSSLGIPWLTALASGIAIFEGVVVLLLRAHYSLDVFTGAVVAFWIWGACQPVARALDAGLKAMVLR